MSFIVTSLIAAAKDIPLGTIDPVTNAYSKGSTTEAGALSNFELLISNIIGFLTTLAAIFFVVYFFMGAFSWVTSGGDKGKTEKARDQITQGVLGLVLIIAAYAIIGLVGSIIGLKLLQPAALIKDLIP
jgi:amino acid transporter